MQVLGQRPLDLAASTMFGLYNGPLDDPRLLERPLADVRVSSVELPPQDIPVDTGNALVNQPVGHATSSERAVLESVGFAFNSAQLLPGSFAELAALAVRLSSDPELRLEIVGHTDNQGSENYNQDLSERRALGVKSYLVTQGIDAERISARGVGESEPLQGGDSEEAHALNRRVEVILTRDDALIPSAGAAVIGFSAWRHRCRKEDRSKSLVDWDGGNTGSADILSRDGDRSESEVMWKEQ